MEMKKVKKKVKLNSQREKKINFFFHLLKGQIQRVPIWAILLFRVNFNLYIFYGHYFLF